MEQKQEQTKQGETFHNDINKVCDLMYCGISNFLESYSYLSKEDCIETMRNVLYIMFSLEDRKEYHNYLVTEGYTDFARELFKEFYI